MKVFILPWKFPWKLVEVNVFSRKLVEASTEAHGIFLCQWEWKLLFFLSIAACTNVFRGSFHELLYTPTYFHLITNVQLLQLDFHKGPPASVRSSYMEVPPASIVISIEVNFLRWK